MAAPITKEELDAILADLKQMYGALAEVAMQVPDAADIVGPRCTLPSAIDMVFEQAAMVGAEQPAAPAAANDSAQPPQTLRPALKALLLQPRVLDLTKRMIKMSVASNSSIALVGVSHFACLASLALEDAEGDVAKASKTLRASMEELITVVEDPGQTWKKAVHDA